MTNYKDLRYILTTNFYKLNESGEPTGEKWKENLGVYRLPDGSSGNNFYKYAETIITSFGKLFQENSYKAGDKTLTSEDISIASIGTEITEDPEAGIDIGSDTVQFSLTVKTITSSAENVNVKLPGYWVGNLDSDTAPVINDFGRALTNLSRNNFRDVTAITTLTIETNEEG